MILLGAALAGPFVLAFFSGGYFDLPRVWAGLIAWGLLAGGLLTHARRPPLRLGSGGRLAVLGLAGLAIWTLLSVRWAPVPDGAYHRGQLVLLYVGGLGAAAVLLSRAPRTLEPAIAAGSAVVIGYGLAGRMLPGVVSLAHSLSAAGRLEQPLTYWNAMGELAALGLIATLRLAGDEARRGWLRAGAAAAGVSLALGLYLSFSRGALFATAAGLIALVILAPTRAQARAVVVVLAGAALAILATAPSAGMTALAGTLAARERQGALALAATLVGMAIAARLTVRRMPRDASPLRLPRRAGVYGTAVILAGLAFAIAVGAHEGSGHALSTGSGRLISLESNRYAYWDVALRDFAQRPLTGLGAGGWAVSWLQHRQIAESAQDAHSLPLQTLAELGLVGAGLLLLSLGGVVRAARAAVRHHRAAAAGPAAVCVAWLAHQPLDWDWEMPALTLVAVLAAGALLALEGQSCSATRGA